MMVSRFVRFLLILCLATAGCSDDGNGNENKGDDTGTNGDEACPFDMAGPWTITDHCSDDQVGNTVTWTQEDCTNIVPEEYPDWYGEVAEDGTVTSSSESMGMECVGTVEGDTLTLDCNGDECHVVMIRD